MSVGVLKLFRPCRFHGIVIIGQPATNNVDGMVDIDATADRGTTHCASTPTQMPPPSTGFNQFGPQSKNLASIIRGIKSAVTTQVRKMDHHAASDFAWQSRFHDHIIRDDASYQRISNYIIQNPANWAMRDFSWLIIN